MAPRLAPLSLFVYLTFPPGNVTQPTSIMASSRGRRGDHLHERNTHNKTMRRHQGKGSGFIPQSPTSGMQHHDRHNSAAAIMKLDMVQFCFLWKAFSTL
ncbi:hypothetical protein NPIL_331881 [Nephila pilipes]|uniref:Uncharacterized protein n=1 Tax=Nephila pilipes TaxID=299642 RepID=A0A8X6R0R9_NEPPI|nr:hypothetical protein NPIL_331881 [Nephila pilipes]